MIPVTHPTFTNPFNGFGDCKISYLSSVSGLVAWTDYIPVITVTASSSIEGRTEANGYQNVHPVGATGNVAWTDYIPVYEDATKTVPWSTDANGYIPVGMSEDGVLGFLSQAEFQADLTHSLVLDAGTGSPTFTRASTATFRDWEGVLKTVPSGCARFEGGRMVRNHLLLTESLTTAATWTKINGGTGTAPVVTAGQSDPDGGSTAFRIQAASGASATGSDYSVVRQSMAAALPETSVRSIYIKSNTGSSQTIYFGIPSNNNSITATAEWQRLGVTNTSSSVFYDIGCYPGAGTGTGGATCDVLVWHPQLEDVTGQADQTASEYVSVGVGVQTVVTEDFSSAANWTLNPGWSISGGQMTGNGAASQQASYDARLFYQGQKVEVTGTVTARTSGSFIVTDETGASQFTVGATGAFSGVVTFPAASTKIVFFTTPGFVGSIDNVTMKLCDHGAGVDGVKFFNTDRDGALLSPQPAYLAEGARTNLCLQSNGFGTTPWVALTTPTLVQDATGPNGQANYAWTMTDNDVSNYEGIQQNNVAWAAGASGCYSILVGKKASNPAYPLVFMYYNRASNLYHYVIVNEVLGTVAIGGSTNPPAYGCVSFNDDFWLVWVSGTQAGATVLATLDLYAAGSTDGTTLSAAVLGSTVFADAQFESGTTEPTSRIPTTTAAVTRAADVLTYTGGDIANLKTLCATFRREVGVSNVGVVAALSDGTLNEYSGHTLQSATGMRFEGVDGGVLQWGTTASNAYSAGSTAKVAQSTATNDIKMAKDGVGQTPDTVATIPTVTQLNVGHLAGSFQLNGTIRGVYGWTRNLSQSELNAITA